MMQNVFGPVPVATSGICIAGMGDCGPKVNNVSQSFSDTLNENIKNTLVSKSTSIGAVMSSEQIVDFSGADLSRCEEVTISGISQKAVLNYNFSMMENAYDESSFVDMVKNNVEKTLNQKIEAKSEALNGGNSGTVNNLNQNYVKSVSRLVNSISYNDFKNIMSEMRTRQKISFAGMTLGGRFCNIQNLSQDVMMEMAARMISDKITKEFISIARENEQKEAVTSEGKFMASGVIGDLGRGLSAITSSIFTGLGNVVGELTKPWIILGIIIIIAILAYVIYRALMSGKLEGFAKDPVEEQRHAEEMRRMELEQQQMEQQGPPRVQPMNIEAEPVETLPPGAQLVTNPQITNPLVTPQQYVQQYVQQYTQPGTSQPGTSQPGTSQPGTSQQYAPQPSAPEVGV